MGVTRRALFGLRPAAARPVAADSDVDEIRRANAAAWAGAEGARLRRALEPAARTLAELAAPRRGDRILTIECGEPLDRLPHPTGSFDVVLSPFGAALEPEPDRAVTELARVARPGGTVGITAWVPRGLPGRLPEYVEAIRPLPPGVPSPRGWGREPAVRARLEALLGQLEVRTRVLRLTFASPEEAFATLAGPLPLSTAELDRLRPDFDRLLASCNDSLDGVELSARYLLAIGRT